MQKCDKGIYRFETLNVGETHQIILRDLKDPGVATVEWICGDLETKCKLTVKGKPARLIRGLQAQSVPINTDVVMSVRLSKPVNDKAIWKINNSTIAESYGFKSYMLI